MCEWFVTDLWFVTEKKPETREWFGTTESKTAISQETTNHKPQPIIILKRLNLMHYVQSITRSLLSFLF